MKLIIAGGRKYEFTEADKQALDELHEQEPITEVVSEGSPGAAKCGELWAREYGIPVRVFHADWATHGKAAIPLSSREMVDYADAVILFPGGRGTASMCEHALAAGIRVFDPRDLLPTLADGSGVPAFPAFPGPAPRPPDDKLADAIVLLNGARDPWILIGVGLIETVAADRKVCANPEKPAEWSGDELVCFAMSFVAWAVKAKFGDLGQQGFGARWHIFESNLRDFLGEYWLADDSDRFGHMTYADYAKRAEEYGPLFPSVFPAAPWDFSDVCQRFVQKAQDGRGDGSQDDARQLTRLLAEVGYGMDTKLSLWDVVPSSSSRDEPVPEESASAVNDSTSTWKNAGDMAVMGAGCVSIGLLQILLSALPIAVAILIVIAVLRGCS